MAVISLQQIFDAVKSYNPDADFSRIEKAYHFAEECHKGQYRDSGEPFFLHPETVALIVASELKLDVSSICAALLHDVVEDTPVSEKDIEQRFGASVARIVDGVTKLNKCFFTSPSAAQAASFRKMVLAMTKDLRVILIKLADRLHNIRTIQYKPVPKQRSTARETLEIYAPLAHRLGINKIKSEFEERCFRILQPEKAAEIEEFIKNSDLESEANLKAAMAQIKEHLKEVDVVNTTITGRPKQAYSIYNKAIKYNTTIDGLYDFLGIRILTESVKDCYAALGMVHKYWKPIPGRFKDYIAVPKANMYQSLHTTVLFNGKPLEVQIRTYEMHKVAEEGVAAHWDYKETGGSGNTLDYKEKLSFLRNIIDSSQDIKDDSEFMENVKVDMFESLVYVFTPRGDVKELPKGSTPIDFAYSIHTNIGEKCSGAIVNGKIVPLSYKLENGDCVSITTNKNQRGPKKDWLKIVGSTSTKRKIRAWLKKDNKDEYILQGEREFLEAFQRLGGDREIEKTFHTGAFANKVKDEIGFSSLDDFYAAIGADELKSQQVVAKLFPDLAKQHQEKQIAAKNARKIKEKAKVSKGPRIICGGLDGALIKISRCCSPIPGDDIIGYITRGRGVTIHKKDCPNAKNLESEADRLIDVRWDLGIEDEILGTSDDYKVKIRVETSAQRGMINSVTSVIANFGINIISASCKTTRQREGILDFIIEVKDSVMLKELLYSISKLVGVSKAYRVEKTIAPSTTEKKTKNKKGVNKKAKSK